MPPLRSRREDIPSLAVHFARKICAAERIPLKSFTVEALDHLCSYTWPGNVRQLENAVEMAIILSGERISLDVGDFPLPETRPRSPSAGELPLVALPEGGLDYEQTLALIERSILDQALRKTGGNKKAAAQMLRLSALRSPPKCAAWNRWRCATELALPEVFFGDFALVVAVQHVDHANLLQR